MRLNPAVARISPYVGGRPIDEVAREYGISDVVKLASNESPVPPFPEVLDAITVSATTLHRYPDSHTYHVARALAGHLGVATSNVWFGAGSSELIGSIAMAIGGPGTNAVFAWPSFAMYPIATLRSGAEPRKVPLDVDLRHDLAALGDAADADTTVVWVCNPNNPTGTLVPADDVEAFARSLPPDVLVVIDEAYHEYVTDADHRSLYPVAVTLPNVVVLRTFSKIYGLAGLRIGYAVGRAETLAALRRPQRPFTVTQLAQDAATEAIRHQDQVAQRRHDNESGRHVLTSGLADRGLVPVPSQTNFVFVEIGGEAARVERDLLAKGVIVRRFDGAIRVSVGSEVENRRFLLALDQVL